MTGDKLETNEEHAVGGRYRTLSKDYEQEIGISADAGVQNIGKVYIDGKRVETTNHDGFGTTLPSGKDRSPQNQRRASLKYDSNLQSTREAASMEPMTGPLAQKRSH